MGGIDGRKGRVWPLDNHTGKKEPERKVILFYCFLVFIFANLFFSRCVK